MEPDNLATAQHFLDNIAGDDLTTIADQIAYAQAQAWCDAATSLRQLAATADDLRRVVFANVPNTEDETGGSRQGVI